MNSEIDITYKIENSRLLIEFFILQNYCSYIYNMKVNLSIMRKSYYIG